MNWTTVSDHELSSYDVDKGPLGLFITDKKDWFCNDTTFLPFMTCIRRPYQLFSRNYTCTYNWFLCSYRIYVFFHASIGAIKLIATTLLHNIYMTFQLYLMVLLCVERLSIKPSYRIRTLCDWKTAELLHLRLTYSYNQ